MSSREEEPRDPLSAPGGGPAPPPGPERAEEAAAVDGAEDDEDDDDPVTTPFDHPLFLPVLLLGLSCWFGWDGFLTSDPEMQEHSTFNRVGFAILFPATLYYGYKGILEWREMQAEVSADSDPSA